MIYDADLNKGFFNSLHYLNKYYGIIQNAIKRFYDNYEVL